MHFLYSLKADWAKFSYCISCIYTSSFCLWHSKSSIPWIPLPHEPNLKWYYWRDSLFKLNNKNYSLLHRLSYICCIFGSLNGLAKHVIRKGNYIWSILMQRAHTIGVCRLVIRGGTSRGYWCCYSHEAHLTDMMLSFSTTGLIR